MSTAPPRGLARTITKTAGRVAPDGGFDCSQEPTRRGARIHVRLLNEPQATVRSWDGVKRQWRFTKLGQKFYQERHDSYVVIFPAKASRVRVTGAVHSSDAVAKSADTKVGVVKLPTLMPDAKQLAEAKRRVAEYVH